MDRVMALQLIETYLVTAFLANIAIDIVVMCTCGPVSLRMYRAFGAVSARLMACLTALFESGVRL